MSAQPSQSLESIASSLPQVRLATQAEALSTQVQDTWRRHDATAGDEEPRDIESISNTTNTAARATLQILCDGALNSRPRSTAGPLSSRSHSMKRSAVDNDVVSQEAARKEKGGGPVSSTPFSQRTDRGRSEEQAANRVDDQLESLLDNSTRLKASGAPIDDLRPTAQKRLQSIWDNEAYYGIPLKWRAAMSDAKVLILYLNLCQQVKKEGRPLSILWTRGTRYLETACENEGRFCPRAIEKAAKRIRSIQTLPPQQPLAPPSSVRKDTVPSLPGSHVSRPVTHVAKGKTIVRRATKVPKDQVTILDCPQSYYPPLPGQDKRPGPLPVKLLELFSAQVDEAAHCNKPDDQIPVAQKAQISQVEDAGTNPEVTEQLQEDTESDEEVGASQWPPSPDRGASRLDKHLQEPESSRPPSLSPVPDKQRRAQLPPDSSPLDDLSAIESDRNRNTAEEMSIANESAEEEEYTKSERDPPVPVGSSASAHRGATETQLGATAILDLDTRSNNPESSHPDESGLVGMDPQHSEQPYSNGDTPVQIKRTPYPGKCASSAREAQRMSDSRLLATDGPASTFIPSTYHETTIDNPRAETHGTAATVTMTPPGSKTGPYTSQQGSFAHSGQAQSIRSSSDFKNMCLSKKGQDAREYRRSVLKPISKEVSSPVQQVSKPDPLVKAQSHNQSSSHSPEGGLHKTPAQSIANDTTTALTSSSVAPLPPPRVQEPLYTSAVKRSEHHGPTDAALFQRFSNAYPEYEGSKKQFDVACRLLSKQCSLRQLHSFLLDDFVFHYTQSYRNYLAECYESGDEAVPYADYFDSIEPTHMKRVISPSDLEQEGSHKDNHESIMADQKKRPVTELHPQRADGRSEDAVKMMNLENDGADTSRTKVIGVDASISTTSKQHLNPSQQSSVEKWIQNTMATRAESPELGTPDVDRSLSPPMSSDAIAASKSLKRSLAIEPERSSTSKRTRLSPAPSPFTTDANFVRPAPRQRSSLPQATLAGSKPRHQPPSSTAPPPASMQQPRRSLPPSFSSVRRKSINAVASTTPAAASAAQTPSKPERRHLATQPLRPPSKPSTPMQKPAHASRPASASPFVRPATGSKTQPVRHIWSQDENTAFKRFAASWRNLPALNKSTSGVAKQSATAGKKTATTAGANPYALVDVTQWRK